MLSIIIPTHDEEKRILPTLEALTKFLSKRYDYEIIVVDDGADATAAIVRRFAAKNKRVRVKLLRFAHRIGKGGAVKQGLLAARGNCVVYDADAATPPTEIPKLERALERYEIAIGSRRASGARAGPLHRRIARRCLNLLTRLLFGWGFRDTQCGFKALRKRPAKTLARELKHDGYEFDVELLARARKHGFSIAEIPVEWRHVPGGPIERADAFKKIVDALRMLAGTIKIRFEA